MIALAAAAPLALVLLLMGALRRSAAQAGVFGLALALALSVTLFDLARPGLGWSDAALGTGAEALFSTFTILWIILPALALYEFQTLTGAIARIRDVLSHLTENRRIQAILIAWFFGLFMEGAAGFGVPVALAAPLLAGLGYPPVRAVALALLGHAAGVSFGAVGTPTLAQVDLTGLDQRVLAGTVAGLHAALGGILLIAMVRLADDGPLTRADWGWSALALICFVVPSLALAWTIGPELPSLGGALIGLVLFAALLRRKGGEAPDMRNLLPDLAPYLAILALVLATRLIGPLTEALRSFALDWTLFESFSGRFEPLYHPGTLLLLGLALGALLTGRASLLAPALAKALKRMVPVAAALLAMLALSRVMVQSGMIAALADAAALTGATWPLIAPAIGVLGTFITGSATASNILFTELQVSTAAALALSPIVLAAAQGFGSAIGNIVAPHNIIAGSATVGMTGREGDVLAETWRTCLIYTLLGGGLVFLLTQFQ